VGRSNWIYAESVDCPVCGASYIEYSKELYVNEAVGRLDSLRYLFSLPALSRIASTVEVACF